MEESTATIQSNLLQIHFNSGMDGQYVLDPAADVFVKVNPAFCELVGYSAEQLVESKTPLATGSLVHPEDRELVTTQRKQAARPGERGSLRFRVVLPEGEVRTLEICYSVVNHLGRILHVGSARDVSEQVKLESKLRSESDYNRELSLEAQRAAKENQKKNIEIAEANTRISALAEVLRAIPVLTKRLLELKSLADVFKETAQTMVGDAGFASCNILLKNAGGELEIKTANPARATIKLQPNAGTLYQAVLQGAQSLAIDEQGAHIAPITAAGEIRGILHVGLPKNLARFYKNHTMVAQSIKDLVTTIADFLGLVISNHENLERVTLASRTDNLTGLFNRRVFEENLTIEFRRALRYQRDLSLLILDIDHFKKVNDTWGHQQGDAVLEAVGTLLKGSFRDLDSVCRYGGEEMCAILPETVGEAARSKAEYLRRKIEELRIPLLNKPEENMQVTVSIGVACVSKTTISEDQLLREADSALYECKSNGRNRVLLAKPT
jgi:diguanylate cyclase (GGDEF)-like protein/PAS domain S-box-containing protein